MVVFRHCGLGVSLSGAVSLQFRFINFTGFVPGSFLYFHGFPS